MDWYYSNGRSKHGPIDEDGIRIRVEKGYITGDTRLWHEGLDGWKKASELGFVSASSAPPPAQSFAAAAPSEPLPRQEVAEVQQPAQPSINVSVNTESGLEQPVSVGNWILAFLVAPIPVIGQILLFVWAFGGAAAKSKANWAKAILLLALIGFLGWFLFFVLLASAFRSAL